MLFTGLLSCRIPIQAPLPRNGTTQCDPVPLPSVRNQENIPNTNRLGTFWASSFHINVNSCQGDRTLVNTHIACVRMFACVYLHLSTTRMPGIYGGQKRALDRLELEFQSMVSYSGAEPSPGEEQPVPLAAELSLQPVHLSLDDSLLTIHTSASVAFLHSSFPIYLVWNVNVKVLSLLPQQFRVSCTALTTLGYDSDLLNSCIVLHTTVSLWRQRPLSCLVYWFPKI